MSVVDQGLWEKFCREYGPGFASTVHIPGLVREAAIGEAGLRDALRAATTRTGPDDLASPRVRVYTGNRLDYVAAERLAYSRFDGVDLCAWFDDVCPADDMCLAFNEIDTWSPGLADLLARDVACPLADVVGAPRAGLEWYSFIGRSGYTPFGLHSDPEPSMIFHLGPAPKDVWIWDPETLAQLPNHRQITFDFADLLPAACRVTLAPGDFLLIPAFHFHIFRNNGFAAFIGLTIFPQDVRQELANIVMHLAPRPGSAYFAPDAAGDVIRGGARALVRAESFADDVDAALDVAERRLRSVAWTKKSAVTPTRTSDDDLTATEFVVTERPIVPAGGDRRPAVFVDARTVALPTGCDPVTLVAALRPGRRLAGGELLHDVAEVLGSTTSAVALVRALEACGGIRPAIEFPGSGSRS